MHITSCYHCTDALQTATLKVFVVLCIQVSSAVERLVAPLCMSLLKNEGTQLLLLSSPFACCPQHLELWYMHGHTCAVLRYTMLILIHAREGWFGVALRDLRANAASVELQQGLVAVVVGRSSSPAHSNQVPTLFLS
jgi:hypothetical protein